MIMVKSWTTDRRRFLSVSIADLKTDFLTAMLPRNKKQMLTDDLNGDLQRDWSVDLNADLYTGHEE